jgi:diacylglycerol kinase (ATP)
MKFKNFIKKGRAMGWGGTYTTIDVKTFLQLVGHYSHKVLLDRWKIDIDCNNEKNKKIPNKSFTMYNYCGIGLDAKFCLSFHNLRETKPHLFQSRVFKIISVTRKIVFLFT